MRILIVGAGGIGGYFGGRLVEAGADVTFLVRAGRAQQLASRGLIVESPLGDINCPVKTTTSLEGIETPEIIIIACKAYGLDGVLTAISHCAGRETVILPLLNGIAHLEAIEQRIPTATVWGGLAHIGVTLDASGTIKHLNDLHTLMFGSRSEKPLGKCETGLVENFRSTLAASSIDGQLQPGIEQDLWNKYVFLTTLAGSTCLMRASIGTIMEAPGGEHFILQLLDESARIATAEGFMPDREHFARYRSQLTKRGSTSKASMLRDIEQGGPTEAEHILGDMAARARKHAIAAPGLEIALTHLRCYEHRQSAEKDKGDQHQ